MRKVIIVITLLIILVNLVIFFYPSNKSAKSDVEAQLHSYLNEILSPKPLEDPDYLLVTELQSEAQTLSDQIRAIIHGNTNITIKSIDKNYLTVEIMSPKLGSIVEDIFNDFDYENSSSFNENRITLLSKIYSHLNTTEIEYQTETVNVEYIKVNDNYEAVLNQEFYNALYGGLVDLLQTTKDAFMTEGDIVD